MRAKTYNNHKILQNLLKLLVIVAAIILVVFILINKSNSSPNTSSTTKTTPVQSTSNASNSNDYATLTPATVAPKVAECNQAVNYDSSGAPTPIQCSNGYLNVAAWNALSAQEPKLMSLGYSPTQSDIQSAVCSDITASASDSAPGADYAIETAVFQISALYYGWNNAGSISSDITSC